MSNIFSGTFLSRIQMADRIVEMIFGAEIVASVQGPLIFHRLRRGAMPKLLRGNTMTVAGIIAFLFGAGLAQKFRILILVPPLLATILAAAVASLSADADMRSIALTAVVAAVAMQSGYLAGAILRWWKVSRSRKASAAVKPDNVKPGPDALPVH